MTILLTSVGRRCYLVEYFQQALAGQGRVVCVNSEPLTSGMAAADRRYTVPRIDSDAYIPCLLEICQQEEIGLMLSLCCALPGLAGFTALAGAVTAAQSKGGFLAIFISGPLLIPLLIFGTAATYGYVDSGLATPALRVTLGLSLLSLAISIPASAAAFLHLFEHTASDTDNQQDRHCLYQQHHQQTGLLGFLARIFNAGLIKKLG